jgi:hypothetical protein
MKKTYYAVSWWYEFETKNIMFFGRDPTRIDFPAGNVSPRSMCDPHELYIHGTDYFETETEARRYITEYKEAV